MSRLARRFRFAATLALAASAAGAEAETFQAGPLWQPLDFTPAQIAPGSALDFSPFLGGPIGPGDALAPLEGRFASARQSGRSLKGYGVVMSHGMPFGDHAESDRLVSYLAASGYNLVRLHLYTAGTPSVMAGKDSPEFRPEARERFDYFLAALRRRGIYFMFPLNGWGMFDGALIRDVPELKPRTMRADVNPYLPISRDASDWLKAFARGLLLHRNPYTGDELKDDPALVGIELSNEDSLFWELHRNPAIIPIYRRVERERMAARLNRPPTDAEAEAAFPEFVLHLQDEFFADYRTFLQGIGVGKPLTDATDHDPIGHVLNRSRFDYVDLHGYWALYHALPGGSGAVPAYQVTLANPNLSRWSVVVSATAPGRIFGRPFVSGEFNSSYPSPYWPFTGPFEAALAAEQGWSGVTRCGLWPYPATAFNPSPSLRIESGHSPVMMLSERIGALLYSQGDLAPLAAKAPIVFTEGYLRSRLNLRGGPAFPPEYTLAAYRCQIGSILWTGPESVRGFPVVVLPADETLPPGWPGGTTVVRTGQSGFAQALDRALAGAGYPAVEDGLDFEDGRGAARIVTAGCETFLLPAAVASDAGRSVGVAGNSSCAVIAAGSLDHRALSESAHVLFLYLTEVRNTGTEVEPAPKESVIVRKIGTTPLLLRQGTIEVTLRTRRAALPRIWALRFDGSRAAELQPRRIAGGFSCSFPAQSAPDIFSAFEATWDHPSLPAP